MIHIFHMATQVFHMTYLSSSSFSFIILIRGIIIIIFVLLFQVFA